MSITSCLYQDDGDNIEECNSYHYGKWKKTREKEEEKIVQGIFFFHFRFLTYIAESYDASECEREEFSREKQPK